MRKLIYRKREKGRGGFVELEGLQDGDELTDIEALIVALKEVEEALIDISSIVEAK